jgi:hypothetical protein
MALRTGQSGLVKYDCTPLRITISLGRFGQISQTFSLQLLLKKLTMGRLHPQREKA